MLALAVLLVSSSFAAAANTQGLEWGVTAGDTIDYLVTYNNDDTGNIDEVWDVYVEIPTLPTISDNVTSITQMALSASSLDIYFSNGTQLSYYSVPVVILAIGNWTLAGALLSSSTSTVVITETSEVWKYSAEQEGSGYVNLGEMHFSKLDGAVNYYYYGTTNDENVVTHMIKIVRDGYNPGIVLPGLDFLGTDLMLPLIIGGAVVVVLVIVIVIRKK